MNYKSIKSLVAMLALILVAAEMTGGKALAQSSAPVLEGVVVTAQRREQDLQSVPIAISAFTEDTLITAGIDSTQDLANIAPGMVWLTGRTGASVYLRGVGTQSQAVGQEQPVAIYVDGIYYPNMQGSTLSLANIQQVEVLRGPQGTLFGRNAVGGLVNIITKTPSQQTGGLMEVGYGNYDTIQAKFYGTTGVTDRLAADLSVFYHDQSGNWGRNLFLDEDINSKEEIIAVRSKWHWEPTQDTRLTLAMDYNDREGDIGSHRNLHPGGLGQDGTSTFVGGIHDSQENVTSEDLTGFVEQSGVSLAAEHDLQAVRLRGLAGYRHVSMNQFNDVDATPVQFFDLAITDSSSDDATLELHVLSPDHSAIEWILGMFYMNREAEYGALDLFGSNFPPGGLRFQTRWDVESIAGFAQATFPVLADTNLTLGLRHTRDTTDFGIDLNLIADGAALVQAADDSTWDETTWRVVLDHRFSDDIMGYVSYNRGFKAGIYNVTDTSATPVDPEILDAYEVGLKMDLLDRRLRLNGVAFYSDYQDLQMEVISGVLVGQITAPTAEIWGLEVDMEAAVTERLNLRGNVSWIPHAEYGDFPAAPFYLPNPEGGNLEVGLNGRGQRVVHTPEYTLNLGVAYTLPVSFGSLIFGGDYYYNDGSYWTVDNRISGNRRDMVNLTGTWKSHDESWNVRLWANNLLDEEYYTEGSLGDFGDVMSPGAPRTYGVSIGREF